MKTPPRLQAVRSCLAALPISAFQVSGFNFSPGPPCCLLPAPRSPLPALGSLLFRFLLSAFQISDFPPVLRRISALLVETSDEWEAGKIHLNMQNQNPPSV